MDRRLTRAACTTVLLSAGAAALAMACARPEPPRRYPLRGQVLSVHADRQQITVRHEDIPGFMPAMTMSFPVEPASLLAGREPGELIVATLEVTDTTGRLTAIERTGFEALPADANAALMAGHLLEPGDLLPDAAFIDETDTRRALADWRGSLVLLTFIYTRCPLPNYCPLMDRHFRTLQQAIGNDGALRGRVRLLTITFDPEFDTPAVLAAHGARLGADPAVWSFLTGDRPTIDRFAARLGVGLVRPAGSVEITHNLRTVLADASGRIVRIYSGNEWTPAQALADLRSAVRLP